VPVFYQISQLGTSHYFDYVWPMPGSNSIVSGYRSNDLKKGHLENNATYRGVVSDWEKSDSKISFTIREQYIYSKDDWQQYEVKINLKNLSGSATYISPYGTVTKVQWSTSGHGSWDRVNSNGDTASGSF